MSKNGSKNGKQENNHSLSQEIWGVIYGASGLLVCIALVSYWVNPSDNILGPYIGLRLSWGLLYLFGPVSCFFVPVMLLVIGIAMVRGRSLPVAQLFYIAFIAVQISVLGEIRNIPRLSDPEYVFPNNALGNTGAYLLRMLFGNHQFGPYFIVFLAIFITFVIIFRIPIKESLKRLIALAALFFRKIKDAAISALNRKEDTPSLKGKEVPSLPKSAQRKKSLEEPSHNEKTSDQEEFSITEEDSSEEDPIAAELAAFRAKKQKPLTILYSEEQLAAEEGEDSELISDEPDIGSAAMIDPTLLNQDSSTDQVERVSPVYAATLPESKLEQYILPSPDILPDPPLATNVINTEEISENSAILEKTLLNFGIEGKVVNVSPGPVVTRYEIELAPGVKISRVVSLQDDIALAVGGKKIRIEAPIPGKAALGIELPNKEMQVVYYKHILLSDAFRKSKAKLPIIIGKNVAGMPYVADITKMPHLLIAGQTGSGKSVSINSFVCSLLFTKTPEELRLILIDPKKVEMSYYENIPHLLAPVVTESKEAVKALQWAVMEMTRRYRLLAKVYTRNIDSFNQKVQSHSIPQEVLSAQDNKPLPFIVIIVDELADLMITASRDVEVLIQRIAQLARAVGIHLVVATQRPSVDIITGPIKANLTSRIAFRTIQYTDSRTILDSKGAEKLLGRGDMLFLRSGAPDIERYHGAFISEEDVEMLTKAIHEQGYSINRIESFEEEVNQDVNTLIELSSSPSGIDGNEGGGDATDEKFEEAARIIVSTGLGSTSLLQRRLKLGYARAGRLMDQLERAQIVGPPDGSKAREVLVTIDMLDDFLRRFKQGIAN